jgi:hypothetical protein
MRSHGPAARLLAFPLGPVLGPGLLAVGDPLGVEHAADDVVAHAGQVADAAPPDQDDRVLLQVVPLAGDVRRHLDAVGQADAGHLAQGRVRLLGRHDLDLQTDALLLGASVQGRVLATLRRHARALVASHYDELSPIKNKFNINVGT